MKKGFASNIKASLQRFKMKTQRQSETSESREAYDRLPLFGPLDIANIQNHFEHSRRRFTNLYSKACPFQVKVEDFVILNILGKGAFGKVLLVKDIKNQNYYAMKALEKRHIYLTKQIPHALNEKRILQCLDFPFGVRMEYFSKDNSYIYFFMPFITGGEMFTHLQRVKKFNEATSRFFAAQVVLGFEYLHFLKLIYRDLKPENILIDHLGYLKITDYGFTKPVASRTYTFCGTPHYLAPEVITGHGYGHSVDWWSLGVLIFEMSSGRPPFDANDQMTMFKLILSNRYVMPATFSAPLKDIVDKLLQVDTTKRYGNLKGRVDDIKNHEWFKSLDWMEIFNRRMESPFIPSTSGQGDVTHFPSTSHKDRSFLKISEANEFEEEFKDF